MVTIRPITFTPASRPTQTRYLPSGATIRPIVSPTPSPTPDYERPGGLTRPDGASGGSLSPETIEARSQQVVNTRSAPYSHYVVQGGSWYGVRTVDGMEVRERLNPANANTYPNPDYRYQTVGKGTPTFTEGSAGNVQIGTSARPEAPGPGSSKAAITAYGEAAASWEREQMWRGIDPSMSYQDIASSWDNIRFDVPTQERRQYEISQSLLPQGTTSKQASIEAQYAAQRGTIVSSSGTLRPSAEGYRYSSGELFAVTPTGPAASPGGISGPSLPSPAQLPSAGVGMIGMIARQKLGMDYISGGNMLTSALQANKAPAVTGPIIPTETKLAIRNVALTLPGIRTVWSAGEYIGLDYLLGVKTAEYNKQYSALESQGLISGTEFKGSEAQYNSLNANYQQIESIRGMQGVALDRTLGVNLAGAQAGERWKVPGTQFEPATAAYDFGHGLTTQLSDSWKGIQSGIGKTFEPVAPVAVTMVAGGMMMAGMSPQVIPHTISFVKGFGQGVAATPEFIGMALVGAEGLIKHPQAVPGAAILGGYIQAKGIYEGVTTRPVEFAGEMYGTALALGAAVKVGYAASPVKYTSAAFEASGRPTATYRGLYAESPVRGLRNLVLGGVEGLGTRQLGGLTSYEGRPWYRPTASRGTPSHLVDYLGEGYPDYPALGVKIALTQERLTREGNLPDLINFRQELQTMDQLFRIRPSTIKNPYQEIQNIHGMTEEAGRDFLTTLRDRFPTHRVGGSLGQAVQSRFSRAAADIDLYLPQEQIPAGRTFVAEWNRRHGTTIKVDIHEYPQPGSFIGRYGIRTEKDITVEGVHMMPVREQALRKLSQPMMLRNVEGAWRILPEAHRGKDIADTVGALQSEMYRLQESPVSFLHRGRMQGLQESIDVQMGKMQPGALPVERIGGRTYDPSGAAATRYRQYRWDYSESPYVKIPGTRKYIDVLQYDIFNRPIPIYQELGIGQQTPSGIIFEAGGKVRLHPEERGMWERMTLMESQELPIKEDIFVWNIRERPMSISKSRRFGSVDFKLLGKRGEPLRGAARQRTADQILGITHTHPQELTGKLYPLYHVEEGSVFGKLFDRFEERAAREGIYRISDEFIALTESPARVILKEAPIHTGDFAALVGDINRPHIQAVLTSENLQVGIVGKKVPWEVLVDLSIETYIWGKPFKQKYLSLLKERGINVFDYRRRSQAHYDAYKATLEERMSQIYQGLGGGYYKVPIKDLLTSKSVTLEDFRITSKTTKQVRVPGSKGTPTTNIRAIEEIPFGEYPSTFKPSPALGVSPLVAYPAAKAPLNIPAHFKAAYPSGVPQSAADFDSLIGYSPAIKKQPGQQKKITTAYPDITKLVTGKYPGIVPPGVPTQYPPFTPPGKTPYPGVTKTGITPYPGITKIIPEKYPGITKTGITPYPGITKIIPEKYPGVRITGGGRKTITGITTGGFGGFKIEEFITETTRQFIPKTTPAPITIPHRWLTFTEEKPKKKPGIRMAPDVLASAWNIESPVPRIRQAFGYNIGMPLAKRQRRNELAISNIQKSRIPTRYVWKMPFEQIRRINVPKVI